MTLRMIDTWATSRVVTWENNISASKNGWRDIYGQETTSERSCTKSHIVMQSIHNVMQIYIHQVE